MATSRRARPFGPPATRGSCEARVGSRWASANSVPVSREASTSSASNSGFPHTGSSPLYSTVSTRSVVRKAGSGLLPLKISAVVGPDGGGASRHSPGKRSSRICCVMARLVVSRRVAWSS